MKKVSIYLIAALSSLSLFTSCSDDDAETITVTETVTVDSSVPTGTTTVSRSGNFVAESGAPTTGSASIITDADGEYFVTLSDDFATNQATGTVSIFLAQSATFSDDPSLGLQKAVGAINKDGAAYFKLADAPAAAYTHVILWCSTAGVPFGNAELK